MSSAGCTIIPNSFPVFVHRGWSRPSDPAQTRCITPGLYTLCAWMILTLVSEIVRELSTTAHGLHQPVEEAQLLSCDPRMKRVCSFRLTCFNRN